MSENNEGNEVVKDNGGGDGSGGEMTPRRTEQTGILYYYYYYDCENDTDDDRTCVRTSGHREISVGRRLVLRVRNGNTTIRKRVCNVYGVKYEYFLVLSTIRVARIKRVRWVFTCV